MLYSRPGKPERGTLRETEPEHTPLATVLTGKHKPLEAPARWNSKNSSHGSSER